MKVEEKMNRRPTYIMNFKRKLADGNGTHTESLEAFLRGNKDTRDRLYYVCLDKGCITTNFNALGLNMLDL
jgi:hypothetical protein